MSARRKKLAPAPGTGERQALIEQQFERRAVLQADFKKLAKRSGAAPERAAQGCRPLSALHPRKSYRRPRPVSIGLGLRLER